MSAIGAWRQPNKFMGSRPSSVIYRTQSISDAVAISAEPTPEGLLMIFGVLTALTDNLLREGYFLRGALGIFYVQGRGGLPKDDQEATRLLTEALSQ
jgi:hypothetical protein